MLYDLDFSVFVQTKEPKEIFEALQKLKKAASDLYSIISEIETSFEKGKK